MASLAYDIVYIIYNGVEPKAIAIVAHSSDAVVAVMITVIIGAY